MKVSLGEIIDSLLVLSELKSKRLRVPIKYRLAKVFEFSEREVKRFNDLHFDMLKEHGGKELDGGKWDVPEENLQALEKDYAELRSTMVEIHQYPIDLTELENVEIQGDILKLSWLINCGEASEENASTENRPSVN